MADPITATIPDEIRARQYAEQMMRENPGAPVTIRTAGDPLAPSIPGTGMTPFMQQILNQSREQSKTDEAAINKSYDTMGDIATRKHSATKESMEKVGEARKQAPGIPDTVPLPEAPKAPQINEKEMSETITMITALAALGGALTRQPLTAALNSFSAGVHGYVQGKQQVYENSIKEFNTQIKVADDKNKEIWTKYKAALDKHGANVQGAIDEAKLIAAEYNLENDLALLSQGRLVDVMKLHEKQNGLMFKAAEFAQRQDAQRQQREDSIEERAKHNRAMEEIARQRGGNAGSAAEAKKDKATLDREAKMRGEYEKLARPAKDMERKLAMVETAVMEKTPLGRNEAQALISEIAKGGRGTNMQIKMVQNFGDLSTRIGGFLTSFTEGQWTPEQQRQVLALTKSIRDTVVQPEIQSLNQRYTFLANQARVDPSVVVNGPGELEQPRERRGGGSGGTWGGEERRPLGTIPFDANTFLDKAMK